MRALLRLVRLVLLAAMLAVAAAGSASAADLQRQVLAPLFPPDPPAPAEPEPAPAEPAPAVEPGAPAPDPATPRCYGGAAADPENPCVNPELDYVVEPDPARARSAQRIERCTEEEYTPLFKACWSGAPAAEATRTIAILGDSHAAHWRVALQAVVGAKGWRSVSIQRAACPLTAANVDLPDAGRERDCRAWNRQVQRWIAARPQIDTVFTSAHLGKVHPAPGELAITAQRAGYTAAFLRLLRATVKQVVVIRGTPRISGQTIPCVQRALAARQQPPGVACALARSYALRPDPAVEAARRLNLPSVQVADMSRHMCDATWCYPVVGGVLVLRDVSHMTTAFSATMGPYLLRTVNRLSAGWAPAASTGS